MVDSCEGSLLRQLVGDGKRTLEIEGAAVYGASGRMGEFRVKYTPGRGLHADINGYDVTLREMNEKPDGESSPYALEPVPRPPFELWFEQIDHLDSGMAEARNESKPRIWY